MRHAARSPRVNDRSVPDIRFGTRTSFSSHLRPRETKTAFQPWFCFIFVGPSKVAGLGEGAQTHRASQ